MRFPLPPGGDPLDGSYGAYGPAEAQVPSGAGSLRIGG
jgi:hypothetical protein